MTKTLPKKIQYKIHLTVEADVLARIKNHLVIKKTCDGDTGGFSAADEFAVLLIQAIEEDKKELCVIMKPKKRRRG